jgi:branched-chain amino acid transport system ATP-binding protein
MALLDVQSLDAWYGQAQALFGVSLAVDAGEAVALLGRNGAGKSTTLKAIMGIGVARQGRILYDGRRIEACATHRIARLGLGYVPEDRRVFADLTVAENLVVGRLPARDARVWTPEALFELFPGLSGLRGRLAGHMSGGEQQMLTIARTLMGNPRFLLLDEPSEGLAPIARDAIAGALVELKRRGVGMLVSEQNLPFARSIAERVVVLERGVVRFSGSFAALDANPDARTRYLAV